MRSAWTPRLVRLSALVGLIAAVSGCASDRDAMEKQLAKLHDDVTRLQNDTDRMGERLDAMEVRQAGAPRSDERVARGEVTPVTRPKLKVVRVEADSEPSAADSTEAAPDDGPRVLIQGEGKALESRTMPGTERPLAKEKPLPDKPKPEKPKPQRAPEKTQPAGKSAEPAK